MYRAPLCPSSGAHGPKAVTAFGPETHPSCLQQLENQTAYVVTNAIVSS